MRKLIRLFRTYENGAGPVSNSYAPVSILSAVFAGELQMLTLVHTISLAIANTSMKVASLLAGVRRSVAQARADRVRIEDELFHGHYHLSSKNDDDLPLVR
jgi:hypothetical protein